MIGGRPTFKMIGQGKLALRYDEVDGKWHAHTELHIGSGSRLWRPKAKLAHLIP
jgi:hypothetical protein